MSSTITVTAAGSDLENGALPDNVKSPAATWQSTREPEHCDYSPIDRSNSAGHTLSQIQVDDSAAHGPVFEIKESWRYPRRNIFRLAAVFLVRTALFTVRGPRTG